MIQAIIIGLSVLIAAWLFPFRVRRWKKRYQGAVAANAHLGRHNQDLIEKIAVDSGILAEAIAEKNKLNATVDATRKALDNVTAELEDSKTELAKLKLAAK